MVSVTESAVYYSTKHVGREKLRKAYFRGHAFLRRRKGYELSNGTPLGRSVGWRHFGLRVTEISIGEKGVYRQQTKL